jgi:hypothetical protein
MDVLFVNSRKIFDVIMTEEIKRTTEEVENLRKRLGKLLDNWNKISDGTVSSPYEKGVLKTLEWILGGELPIELPIKNKNRT